MNRKCQTCNKEFNPPVHNVNNGYGNYCSKSCAAKARIGNRNPNWRKGIATQRECVVCGKVFKPKNRGSDRVNKYCSHKCRAIDKSGTENPNWRGGVRSGRKGYARDLEMGTKNYRTWKNAVRERDGNKCQLCGSTKTLVVHHIYSYNTHTQLRYALDNGITLCGSCHSSISWHEADFIPYFLMLINPSEITREISDKHMSDKDMIRTAARVAEVDRNDQPISSNKMA